MLRIVGVKGIDSARSIVDEVVTVGHDHIVSHVDTVYEWAKNQFGVDVVDIADKVVEIDRTNSHVVYFFIGGTLVVLFVFSCYLINARRRKNAITSSVRKKAE